MAHARALHFHFFKVVSKRHLQGLSTGVQTRQEIVNQLKEQNGATVGVLKVRILPHAREFSEHAICDLGCLNHQVGGVWRFGGGLDGGG